MAATFFVDVFPNLLCMSKLINNDMDSKLFITHFITSAQREVNSCFPEDSEGHSTQYRNKSATATLINIAKKFSHVMIIWSGHVNVNLKIFCFSYYTKPEVFIKGRSNPFAIQIRLFKTTNSKLYYSKNSQQCQYNFLVKNKFLEGYFKLNIYFCTHLRTQ